MKFKIFLIGLLFGMVSCEQPSMTLPDRSDEYNTLILEGCEYWVVDYGKQMAHKGNCPSPRHQKDTVYIYGVSLRYGTRDTVFEMYPIDSAEIAVGYLKSNGVIKE